MIKQTSERVTGLTAFDALSKFAPMKKQASIVKAANLVKFKDKMRSGRSDWLEIGTSGVFDRFPMKGNKKGLLYAYRSHHASLAMQFS